MSLTEGKLPQNKAEDDLSGVKNRRVLIVTFYWPPSGGGGVQRWLKFAKLLPEHGWSPIVVTPSNPDVPVADDSLLDEVSEDLEVWAFPIHEPSRWLRTLRLGSKTGSRLGAESRSDSSWLAKLIGWIRGNLFVPDARVGWVRPTTKHVLRKLRESPVDLIVTTGPPHSMHLIGLALKRATGIPWVADFRDPWSSMDYLKEFRLNNRAKKRMKTMEQSVVSDADCLLVTSPGALRELGVSDNPKGLVLPNGWDKDDFPVPAPSPTLHDGKPVMGHFGALYGARNPKTLWPLLAQTGWHLRMGGQVTEDVKQDILSSGVSVEWLGDLPHKQAVRAMHECHALLVAHNNSSSAKASTPGKVFECLATGRPLLVIGPEGSDLEARCISWGKPFFAHTSPTLEDDLNDWLQKHRESDIQNVSPSMDSHAFERHAIATELAEMFGALLSES